MSDLRLQLSKSMDNELIALFIRLNVNVNQSSVRLFRLRQPPTSLPTPLGIVRDAQITDDCDRHLPVRDLARSGRNRRSSIRDGHHRLTPDCLSVLLGWLEADAGQCISG